jgi:hypothetical protein
MEGASPPPCLLPVTLTPCQRQSGSRQHANSNKASVYHKEPQRLPFATVVPVEPKILELASRFESIEVV